MSIHDRNKLKRLRRYSSRLNRMIEDGSFESLPTRKRAKLLVRVRSLYDGLSGVISDVALRHILAAAAVVVLGVSACGGGGGQKGDADADVITDTTSEMDAADLTDPVDVPMPDAVPDGEDDAVPDAEEDATPDADEDAELDAEMDADASDVEDDAPTLLPAFGAPAPNPLGITPPYSIVGLPELADLDGDGDEDLLAGVADYYGGGLSYYQNTGTATSPAFGTPTSSPFGMSVSGYIGAPALADIDDDGDLDLFVGEADYYGLRISYQENTGSATAPAFGTPVTNPFGITGVTGTVVFPELADIDGDGDLDLFTGNIDGEIRFYRNTGSASSPAFASPVLRPFGLSDTYYLAAPAITDLDRDGDLDMLVGESDGNFQYFQNTGTATSPAFASPALNPFGLTAVYDLAFPDFSDIDDDGDMDLFAGEYDGDILVFRNTSI